MGQTANLDPEQTDNLGSHRPSVLARYCPWLGLKSPCSCPRNYLSPRVVRCVRGVSPCRHQDIIRTKPDCLLALCFLPETQKRLRGSSGPREPTWNGPRPWKGSSRLDFNQPPASRNTRSDRLDALSKHLRRTTRHQPDLCFDFNRSRTRLRTSRGSAGPSSIAPGDLGDFVAVDATKLKTLLCRFGFESGYP